MALRKKLKIAILAMAALVWIFLVNIPASADSFASWFSISSGTAVDLNGIWGSGSSDVFAVGNSGTILHFDGSAWSSVSSNTTNDLNSVWGSDKSDVFAVGNSGTILHFDGTAWSSVSSTINKDLNSVWGSGKSDVFAVGDSGTILHFNGSSWTPMLSGTALDLNGIWGSAKSDVFAVGNSGTIVHFNGSMWTLINSQITADLQCVWGLNSSSVFSAGKSGTILNFNGSAWSSMKSGLSSDLYGIWGTGGSNVFATGESGTIAIFNGSTWSSMDRNTLNEIKSIRGFSSTDVFAAGLSGTILRYLPPAINSISINQGNQGAIMEITITGSNLAGASGVSFGSGIAVNGFTVNSSNQITASITITVGASTGVRDVSVTTPGGKFTLPGSFTIKQALPTITSVSPNQDRQGATLSVTLTGTNLFGASEVRFGTGIAVNSFTVLSSNQIAASITIAAGAAPGTRDMFVAAPGGSFTFPNSFTVKQALPTITAVSPGQGNREKTLTVTIDGTNLTGASEIQFGTGIIVNSFTAFSSNQITASITITASAATAVRDVSVTTPGGSFTLPNSFTVKQALPVITSVTPNSGSQSATLEIVLNGTNFNGASELRLGTGVAVNSYFVISSNQITASITIVASAATGVRDVSVTTPGGSFTLPNSFTVKQALPAITSLSPDNGSQGATLDIIISGSNLDGAASVSFGTGVTVKSFSNLSPTQLRVNIIIDKEAVTGLRDVSVTTPGGKSTLGYSFNIKEKSLSILFIALIWVGIGIVVVLFIIILNILRRKRATTV